MRAFVFPGQGSQSVGMGKALADASPAARKLFQEVDDALSHHLFRLMVEGPEDRLTLTENAQPAIMANAIATLRVMQREGGFSIAQLHGGGLSITQLYESGFSIAQLRDGGCLTSAAVAQLEAANPLAVELKKEEEAERSRAASVEHQPVKILDISLTQRVGKNDD